MITMQGVVKRYGGRDILKEIHVTFERGKVYAISGPSGAGKTTLLQVVAGYEQPTAGMVHVASGLSMEYAPQDFLLFSNLTLWDHLRLKAMARRLEEGWVARAEQLLQCCGLEGMEQVQVQALSGGERRRLQLVLALFPRADVLLFDEPTSNLDDVSAHRIWELLACECANKTCIICSHAPVPDMLHPERLRLQGGVLYAE
ncbi:carbohydrate ABC transporter ATP-binding protein, CUT1 family [Alicyclobacillus vulcanalis]|uniref:Carbohydrate ABC transporter ATP-binding protein, CUT1 family n=1 Tax=Alicyclobacillus vulcanalis TaxID=252246 RepID=A0A1N7P0V3_9BACL|nr:carbohydrate ABC transporter ATP-binding protein, CUT1 family [Alicyclobacillus vulcanalis]